MKYNMSILDIIIHWYLMMITVIVGGFIGGVPCMFFGLIFFFPAILGISPLFHYFGIDNHNKT